MFKSSALTAMYLGICATLTLCLSACGNYKIGKKGDQDADKAITASDIKQPDFKTVSAKVMAAKCVDCHSAAQGDKGNVNLETYTSTRRSLSLIKAAILDGRMPKNRPPLSPNQKALILNWIALGAPELRGQTGNGPGAGRGGGGLHNVSMSDVEALKKIKMSYETVNKMVIQEACINCHGGKRIEGKVKLESYQDVLDNKTKIVESIKNFRMPKKGMEDFSEVQKALILTWLDDGAAEDSTKTLADFVDGGKSLSDLAGPAKKNPFADVKAQALRENFDKEFIEKGKYYFHLAGCINCHTSDPAQPLGGGKGIVTGLGTFYAPNISSSETYGIGRWSEQDFLRALHEGRKPNGELYFPVFPYTSYTKMKDEDIRAIRAYIMTLPSVETPSHPQKLNWPAEAIPRAEKLLRLGLYGWDFLYFRKQPGEAGYDSLQSFLESRGTSRDLPGKSPSWNRGAYLVEGPLHCTQCHTPRNQVTMGLIVDRWMGGSEYSGEDRPAPNITPETETGLHRPDGGGWTADDWKMLLSEGRTPRGEWVAGEMMNVVQHATSQLTPSDLAAVIEYMMNLPMVYNYRLRAKADAKSAALLGTANGSAGSVREERVTPAGGASGPGGVQQQ